MRNRLSSHLLLLFALVALQAGAYFAIHRAALLRGYDASWIGAIRDLAMYFPIIVVAFWISAVKKFKGNWVLFTTAILLFSIGLLIQYRLYSDPEYNAKNKAAARQEKTDALRMRYINETYDAAKRQMMGLSPAPPPGTEAEVPIKASTYTIWNALTSTYTWVPICSLLALAVAYSFCINDRFISWVQRHSFVIVLFTLVPMAAAVVTSSAGKALGNTTPWEPSKIPFLIGFAGILTARYKDLAETFWGIPRARDVLPLVVMAVMPFIPFFALKDFGQLIVFTATYATLYLVAVRRWPQLLLFVGSVVLVLTILVVGALPTEVQEQVPLLPTIARPIHAILHPRIQQRVHLWLNGFDPPSPNVSWWTKDYQDALDRDPKLKELAAETPATQHAVNVDIWFDRFAFQPAQAVFGMASGKSTGRGLGLGFPEVVPVADSDYVYAAAAEELGLAGGALVFLAIFIFVAAGIRTALDARDMFTKLCAAGLTALFGFQAMANIGGIVRASPMTGITLPFVSHGGFSLITSFAMLGMLMAFSHRNAVDARGVARARPQARESFGPEAVQ